MHGFEPGSHGCHEALHMASFLIDAVDEQLVGHPAIQANADWQKLATTALDALFELYQAIGKQHL